MAFGSPFPSIKGISSIKSTLLRPALTSHYECWFNPPNDVTNWLKKSGRYEYDSSFISLSCSEASLPGSSLATHEINNDFSGVTERHAYRRIYDDRADFTFYVDHDYNIISFFEGWISYIAGEEFSGKLPESQYYYRVRYPDGTGEPHTKLKSGGPGSGYRASSLYINKFERDMSGKCLTYRFIKAYPISINSMPVSYDGSNLLKCTVSFTYLRYVVNKQDYVLTTSSSEPSTPGTEETQTQPSEIKTLCLYQKFLHQHMSWNCLLLDKKLITDHFW